MSNEDIRQKSYKGPVTVNMQLTDGNVEKICYESLHQARFFSTLLANGFTVLKGKVGANQGAIVDTNTPDSISAEEVVRKVHELVTGMVTTLTPKELITEQSKRPMSQEEEESERSELLEYIKETKPSM